MIEEISAQILSATSAEINRCLSAAKLCAIRAGRNLEAAKVAMLDGNQEETFLYYDLAYHAAKSARSNLHVAEEKIYHAAMARGEAPSAAHAYSITLTDKIREYAEEAAVYAEIHYKAHREAKRIAQEHSAQYN